MASDSAYLWKGFEGNPEPQCWQHTAYSLYSLFTNKPIIIINTYNCSGIDWYPFDLEMKHLLL